MTVRDYNPYSTIRPLLGAGGASWLADELEQLRVGSYDMYEMIYWSVPDSFQLLQRGDDDQPIYIPAGRVIVETLNRYMANQMRISSDPLFGTPAEQQVADAFWRDFARRERFYSQFNANKRMGIIRGDWVFHLRGDPDREEGARISIETLHPGRLFPIRQGEDPESDAEVDRNVIVGWHIIEPIQEDGKSFMRRLTYRKDTGIGGPSPITMETVICEFDSWGGPGGMDEKILRIEASEETFPAPIDQLPVYHIPNFKVEDFLWGSSEMRGLEMVLAAVDQAISDEELDLVLNGLGCYATDMGKPTNADGEEIDWDLGPARVVQVSPNAKFERITAISSVAPYQEHLSYLHARLDEAAATPAVAKGSVDVTVAESGIALTIQMGPLLAHAEEKEQIVTDVLTNMLFDLAKWVVGYEGTQFNFLMESTRWTPQYGEKLPVNRDAAIEELISMATANPTILPLPVVWDRMRKLGYEDMPTNDEMVAMIVQQKEMFGAAEMAGLNTGSEEDQQDEDRADEELSQPEEDGGEDSGEADGTEDTQQGEA
jgi:hypothetical protein